MCAKRKGKSGRQRFNIQTQRAADIMQHLFVGVPCRQKYRYLRSAHGDGLVESHQQKDGCGIRHRMTAWAKLKE